MERKVPFIDEFDGIPKEAVRGFLHSLRRIYVSNPISRCPRSIGIVGVKSITQLNYDRSISPFNIQDEFNLPNFTQEQVQELLGQYTEEVGQAFVPEVIESIHKQTAGQPVLVNRFAQILTEALDIPKTEPITMSHFTTAHAQLLYVVFDHHQDPEPRVEVETLDNVTIRSYVVPVVQERPSDESPGDA